MKISKTLTVLFLFTIPLSISGCYVCSDGCTDKKSVINIYGQNQEKCWEACRQCTDLPTFTDDRDGQTYKKVEIGNQTWMAENLNFESENSWCYDDDAENCERYGRLYDWYAVMNEEESSNSIPSGVQGICPDGWHVPSQNEWGELVDYLGGIEEAGGKMKTIPFWKDNEGATNESCFSALPAGLMSLSAERSSSDNNNYRLKRISGMWWSTTEGPENIGDYETAIGPGITNDGSSIFINYDMKWLGFSVRCVKD